MKVILFGKNGQLARRIYISILPVKQLEVVQVGSNEVNFANLRELRSYIILNKPDIIINCAAYTAVESAETDKDLAFVINSEAVKVIAEEAEKLDAWLIHFSTNYVFDGKQSTPYKETDKTNPINVYGESKDAGDKNIISNCRKFIILRVSAIFDVHGVNFPRSILSNAKKKRHLQVVSDQICTPTSAHSIAGIVTCILYRIIFENSFSSSRFAGIYNAVPSNAVSWHEFARHLVQAAIIHGIELQCSPDRIEPVSSDNYGAKVRRPMYAELDTSKLSKVFELSVPNWQLYIPNLLSELKLSKWC